MSHILCSTSVICLGKKDTGGVGGAFVCAWVPKGAEGGVGVHVRTGGHGGNEKITTT
jgi:hypothetical protein